MKLCTYASLAALAALAACGGGSPPFASPISSNTQQTQLQSISLARVPPRVVASERRASWMDARARGGSLAYISDSGVNAVLAFTWPKLRIVGTLSGLDYPQGLCADKSGNVYVTNTQKFDVLAFAHGSVKEVKRLADPGEYPVGCAFDASGDLAVTNIVSKLGSGYGTGSISIYKGAAGSPKVVSDSNFARVFFDGYDVKGNLFFDGQDANANFAIAMFDGKKFTALTVSGATINSPGAVQVVGSHVNVEDQLGTNGYSVMYQTTLKGTTLTVDATAPLLDGLDCVQSFITGPAKREQLICPDSASPAIEVYKYPTGGNATDALYRYVVSPTGAVISP
jgi:hypothetical protein